MKNKDGLDMSVIGMKKTNVDIMELSSHENIVRNEILSGKTNLTPSMYLQPIPETLNICDKPSPKTPKEQANDSRTQPSNCKLLGSAVKQVEVSITSSSIPLVPLTLPKVIPPKPKVPNPFLERASDLSRSIQLLL